MHPHHAHVQGVRRGHAANPQQRDRDGDLSLLREREDLVLGAGLHHPVARKNQRPLGGVDEGQCLAMVAVAGQGLIVRFGQARFGAVPIQLRAGIYHEPALVEPAAQLVRQGLHDGIVYRGRSPSGRESP